MNTNNWRDDYLSLGGLAEERTETGIERHWREEGERELACRVAWMANAVRPGVGIMDGQELAQQSTVPSDIWYYRLRQCWGLSTPTEP